MPLERQPGAPREVVSGGEGRDTLYEIVLTRTPSPAWRAAFLRPPSHLTAVRSSPDVWRLSVHGTIVYFRAASPQLDECLRRIDSWIAYASSVVEE